MAEKSDEGKRRGIGRLENADDSQPRLFATTEEGGGILRLSASLTERLGWAPGQKVYSRIVNPASERSAALALYVEVE